MFSIKSSRPVRALVPTVTSGSSSNASSTPTSTAPTTPDSEASVIDFKPSFITKSNNSKFKATFSKFSKFRTSTKSLLSKTNNKFKQSNVEPPIVMSETNVTIRDPVTETATRFVEMESESGLNIPLPSFPSQVSLIPHHDGNLSYDLETAEEANADDRDSCRSFASAASSPLLARSLTGFRPETSRQSLLIMFWRCLAIGWRYTLVCLFVCMALFAVYGLHWFLALPMFYALHPCSPVWLNIAVSHIRETQRGQGAIEFVIDD